MRLTAAVQGYRLACEGANRSTDTLDWYRQKLQVFEEFCRKEKLTQVEDITAAHVNTFSIALRKRQWHGKPLSDYTVHGYIQVVKGFLGWASREELVDERTVRRIGLPHVEQRVIRPFEEHHINLLYGVAETHYNIPCRHRDRAIIALLTDTGIRAAELCSLTLDCCDTGRQPYIIVMGKGRKQRRLPLGKEPARLLHMYIHRWRPKTDHDRVFCGRGGNVLTEGGLAQIIYRLVREAGEEYFSTVRPSPHTFRHTYAHTFMKHGGDLLSLSRLLGHSNVQTTENYLRSFSSLDAHQPFSVFSTLRH